MNLRSAVWILLVLSATAMGQEALDSSNRQFNDDLIDRMTGSWKLTGRIAGQPADHTVEAEWVLNHQFLRIHEKANSALGGRQPYEAIVFVGYDKTSERYVAHWIDIFGGRASETLGYGHRDGDAIRFTFEYPEGPFHTQFVWNDDSKSWRWEMESKTKEGKWEEFGRMTLARSALK